MRDIKFRGIDQKGNWQYGTYYYGVMYPTSFAGHYINDTLIDENTISEFTGLFDKNGKEIYEGDICTFYNKYSKSTYTRVVRYCPMLACFGLYPNMTEVWQYESDWLKIEDVEIIGNIYEHKELLNQ